MRNKHIAIVGNEFPGKDFSPEIDAADVVVRLNHCANLESGKVGTRIDIIIQAPTSAWFRLTESRRHEKEIQAAAPKVFLTKNAHLALYRPLRNVLSGLDVMRLRQPRETIGWTTGGAAIAMINAANPASIQTYCFSKSYEEFKQYINAEARHHIRTLDDEWAQTKHFRRNES